MNKGLEALKDIRDTYIDSWYGFHRCEIIEKELKDKEKKDKFAEIIKKSIYVELNFEYDEDTERWYVWVDCEGYQVSIFEGQGKEEYDLLKEVLTNEESI